MKIVVRRSASAAAAGGCLLSLLLFASPAGPLFATPLECQVDAGRWSAAEIRAWNEFICIGQVANLLHDSVERSELSSEFVNEIFSDDRWRKHIPVQGVRIRGAIFPKKLVLDNVDIDSVLWLEDCVFKEGAEFRYVRAHRLISFDRSVFWGALKLPGLSVDSSLFMRGIQADSVDLRSAKVSEHVYLDGSRVWERKPSASDTAGAAAPPDASPQPSYTQGAILGYQAHVGGDLVLIDTVGRRLIFSAAHIGGTVKFDRGKAASSTQPSQAAPAFQEINFRQTKIDGSLLLLDLTNESWLLLGGASIERDIEMSGGSFQKVDANNVTVHGEFRTIPIKDHGVIWRRNSILILRNAAITKILFDGSSWPESTDIRGLTYKEFAFLTSSASREGWDVGQVSVSSYEKWLERAVPYSPQPYIQLAQILRERGDGAAAKEIRIAERERARSALPFGAAWLWETSKYLVIGHGYDFEGAWIAVAVLLIVGRLVLYFSQKAKAERFGMAYSFDLLLPIVRLREAHYKVDLEPRIRAYFYFHRLMGYVLASFLIAGLSGLAKTG